ncbi:phytanoyl-CoA dioxygenase family protein [Mycobacterium paraense]|uniref:phytanoyl-CoA dioxygenase family protein n=1 Tax=Mycobacterium paraense TaxID=767916 RepID=UPI000A1529D8|nr:phytanoyl-CoA dioxygenase family protein [Mycobacterium paraense]ORW47988.1 phytanoyl-CoA dioxygenase [Mycobacterium paraense]
MSTGLSQTDIEAFYRDGYLAVADFLSAESLERVRRWVCDVERWPGDADAGWLQHDEQTAAGVRRTRTENFSPFHAELRDLLTTGAVPAMAGQLLGEPAVLYKEKINYKHPGGAGFAAHQDAPAYPHIAVSVSCLLAVDDSTVENGCLEFVAGMHHDLLANDRDGCIRPDIAETLAWRAHPVRAGSLVWFHSHTPHRSGANTSTTSRRALYLTYNAASSGDLHEAYYRHKRVALAGASGRGGVQRVSLIGHFRGIAPAEAST